MPIAKEVLILIQLRTTTKPELEDKHIVSDETNERENEFEDDESHPIPFLSSLDVFAELNGGGGTLTVITAQPLSADRRTLERLLQKIENYLGFVNSDQFPTSSGAQTAENTEIIVSLRAGTDQGVYDLLERSVDWVAEHNARLVWKTS